MSRRRSAAGGSASLPLLPRLEECRAPPSATPFKDTLAPPSPPSSQWERPQCSPSANDRAPPAILPGPASNSCAGLVTRPPPPQSARGAPWRGWVVLQGETPAALPRQRDRPSGTPSIALGDPGISLRDSRHRRQAAPAPPAPFSRHRLPRDPKHRARHGPQLGTLPALAAERGAALRALRAPLWGGREKTAAVFGERGAVIRTERGSVSSTKYAPG